MIDSPHVIIKTKYTPSLRNLNFKYRTKTSIKKSTSKMLDYFADNQKKAFFMLDYFTGKIGKDEETNLILENGKYATQEQIEERKREYSKYIENSNIYKLVISFPKGYLEENSNIKDLEQAMAKKIIPMFLRKCNFKDPKKISYQFSLHANTEHLHFHLAFAEKQPNYMNNKGKISYRYKGMLEQEELSFLKNEIEHFIQREKIYKPLLFKVNKDIDELKKYFNPLEKNFILNRKDINIEIDIARLGELLKEDRQSTRKIKFNSIKKKEIKDLTYKIKNEIFSNTLSSEYEEFLSTLSKLNRYFEKISENNKIDYKCADIINRKYTYLNNYVSNQIVNNAINFRETENGLIQNIIYQNEKNQKSSKIKIVLPIVNKSLQTKKNQIYTAVKHINYELEQAENEFNKLFKTNYEINK